MQLRAFICAVAGHLLRTNPYRQLLPNANFPTSRAQNRGFCALLPASFFPMAPPASNKPHSAEKSTPVWLTIWRIWAGFANSQLRYATIRNTYSYICTHPPCCTLQPLLRHSKSIGPSAPIAYATSVSPPNEAAAWQGVQVLDGKCCCCLAWVPFLQITARTNPCSRHLWGTLARSVASI